MTHCCGCRSGHSGQRPSECRPANSNHGNATKCRNMISTVTPRKNAMQRISSRDRAARSSDLRTFDRRCVDRWWSGRLPTGSDAGRVGKGLRKSAAGGTEAGGDPDSATCVLPIVRSPCASAGSASSTISIAAGLGRSADVRLSPAWLRAMLDRGAAARCRPAFLFFPAAITFPPGISGFVADRAAAVRRDDDRQHVPSADDLLPVLSNGCRCLRRRRRATRAWCSHRTGAPGCRLGRLQGAVPASGKMEARFSVHGGPIQQFSEGGPWISRGATMFTSRGRVLRRWCLRTASAATRTCGALSRRICEALSHRAVRPGRAAAAPTWPPTTDANTARCRAMPTTWSRSSAAHSAAAPVIFVGHSVSAMIGMLADLKAPGLFAAHAMIGPSPCYINDGDYVGGFTRARHRRRARDAGKQLPRLVELRWRRPSWARPTSPSSASS